MNLVQLLAVGKCVDKRPASGSPLPSGELEFLLGLETQKSASAASKSVAGVSDGQRASQTEENGGKFCFPKAYRTTSGSSRRNRISIQGKPAQRRSFLESPWNVRVSASKCLELVPRLFGEKRKLGLRWRLREGLRILLRTEEKKSTIFL